MKSSKLLTILSALAFSSAATAATTDAVGFVTVTVPANSDAVLAVPLNRAAEFKGVIQSIAGNVITVEGTPAWTANQYVQSLPGQTKTYAVQIASGAKEGLIGRVTANGVDTLTITLDASENLSGIGTVAVPVDPDGAGPLTAQADQVDIMPYWTPATLIPSSVPDGTELYVFDNTTAGQNGSPTLLLQYFAGFGWYETVGFTDQSHRPMLFANGFILRNNSTTTPATLSFVGSVPMNKHRIPLKTLANGVNQDQTIGYMSPVPEPLSGLNFGAADNDELFLFDSSTTGKNKSPSTLLVYFGGRWYNSISFQDVTDSTTLQPGNGMIFRKKTAGAPQVTVWQDLQSYLN